MDRSFIRDFIKCVVVVTMLVACGETLYFMNDLSTTSASRNKPTHYRSERLEDYYQRETTYDNASTEVIDTIGELY